MGAHGPWGVSVPRGGCGAMLLPLGAVGGPVWGLEVMQHRGLLLPEPLPGLLLSVPGTTLITPAFQRATGHSKHSAFLNISRFIKTI